MPTSAPREYAIELPGLTAAVLEWGSPDDPLLIALHGFPDTAWTWRYAGPVLADAGWRVVAPFLRGYAPTSLPDRCNVLLAADDAVALHAALGGDNRTVLVGHDWGALAAGVIAGRSDSPFARYVELAVPPLAHLNPTRDTLRTWLRALLRQPARSWYIGYNQLPGLAERHLHQLARRLWATWSPGYDATHDLELLRHAVPDHDHARAVVSYYRTLPSPGARRLAVPPRRPVLYLHGEHDGCLDARFFPVVAARMTSPSSAVLVPDAGHFLQLEAPDVVAAHILDFIGRPAD